MMHPDMLLLAERLVGAVETISQDVKNMSAYIHDLSCSVSYLLHEKRQRECVPGPAYHGSAISGAGQEASAENVYSRPHEQADERPLLHIGDLEHGERSFGDFAATCGDPHENSNVQSSESIPTFTGRIKVEQLPEVEENDESSDVDSIYGDSRNTVRPSEAIARIGFASNPIPQENQCMETSSHYASNSDHTAFASRLPDGQTSVAETSQMKSDEVIAMEHTSVDSEERSHKCLTCEKSFKRLGDLQRHTRVHTGERPYKCNVCEKAFTHNSHLTVHMRSHTGEKPYMCNFCGKTFGYTNRLNQHLRAHYRQLHN